MQRRLPEQSGYLYRRASRDVPVSANPHRAGHFAGIHPEDQPYASDEFDLADDYPPRTPTSSRRYVTSNGQQVIEQGNRRIIVHQEPPPVPRRLRLPWYTLVGVGMVVALLLFWGGSTLAQWWNTHQLDATYGYPRTWQTDQVVGHNDSAAHPTHFIFLNLHAHVMIVEFPGGDISKARVYSGPTLVTDGGDQIPVTAEFQDVNGDGKLDMIVHIGDKEIIYLNDGTQFKPQQ